MSTVKDVEAKLNTHEAVCAERWKETIERIKRLEMVMIGSAGAVIVLMAGVIWKIQMPLSKIQFQPGVNRETTSYANENGWFNSDLIRFRKGRPEKMGGW